MNNTEWQNMRHAKWREEGRCTNCGGERGDEHVRCSRCREKLNAYARESKRCQRWLEKRRDERREAGLCPSCGKPPVGGFVLCPVCRARNAAWQRARNARRKADEIRSGQ